MTGKQLFQNATYSTLKGGNAKNIWQSDGLEKKVADFSFGKKKTPCKDICVADSTSMFWTLGVDRRKTATVYVSDFWEKEDGELKMMGISPDVLCRKSRLSLLGKVAGGTLSRGGLIIPVSAHGEK